MPDGEPVTGPHEAPEVVVVGGGVAGLVCARDLARAGLRVVVLEAAARPGGCVTTVEVDGLVLDAGAESFATRSDEVRDLLGELGLGDDVVPPAASPAWVHGPEGRAVPLPTGGLLGIPGRPWARDVRAAVGLLGAVRASADRVLPTRVGLGPGPSSVAELVGRRLGRRVLDRLVRPVVAGVHSADPALLDAAVVLPGVRARARAAGSLSRAVHDLRAREGQAASGAAVAGLRGGMHRLVTALVADLDILGVPVRTGVRVEALDHAPGHADDAHDDGAWTVRWASGRLTTRRVVVAVPGPAAATLLAAHIPALADIAGAGIRPPASADVELVHLVLDAPRLDGAPRGTGVLVAAGGPVSAKALTHATAKWGWLQQVAGPGRHVVRLSYGRAGQAPGLAADDSALDVALADAGALLGVGLSRADVRGWARTRWTTGLPQADPGHRERMTRVRDEVTAAPGLALTGAWMAGTGLVAVVGDARATARRMVEDAEFRRLGETI